MQAPKAQAIPRRPAGDPTPASYAQRRLWFLDRLEPGSAAYNMPFALRLSGRLEVEALRGALEIIVQRHEVLRTTFEAREEEPYQRAHACAPWPLPVVDLSGWPAPAREEEARRLADLEARRPFDLERGPLLRTTLLRLEEAEHLLLVSMHHIISDGWSSGVMMRELATHYEALRQGRPSGLPDLPIQYGDYAAWQRRSLGGEVLERQLSYWTRQLAGAPPALQLPLDRPRPASPSRRGAEHVVRVPAAVAEGLRGLARREGATPFMVLLAAFQLLLSRVTGQEDVVVGTPIAGRTRRELEGLIGFFVNTLVIRADLGGDPTFSELLARVREATLGAYANQDVPFEMLVERLAPRREPGRQPLFQVMFTMQSAWTGAVRLPGLTAAPCAAHNGMSKFDLTLQVRELDAGLEAAFEYDADLFDAFTVERLGRHFAALLESLCAAGEGARCGTLELLDESERRQVLQDWNATASDFPKDRCIHQLFEEQARLRPEAVAVELGDESLTYRELNARANRVAHALREQGVRPESRVGLCAERSLELIPALLGILKAGAAYVPLDPAYPAERLAFMAKDAGLALVLATPRQRGVAERLGRVLELGGWIASSPGEDLSSGVGPGDLAYVMYTSGSTGEPKGVAIEHRNVVHLVQGGNYGGLGPDQVFLQLATIAFDGSTFEIWGCLLNGGRLVLHPPLDPTLAELAALVERRGVTTLFLTTSLFHLFVQEDPSRLARVRQVLTGGEVLSPRHARRFLEAGGRRLLNCYGPTETTVFACCQTLERPEQVGDQVPIGPPISNCTAYVLDAAGEPVPVGVAGELWIGGEGVGRGYWNRPELTAAKFVQNRWGPGRLYRTGDRARWRPGGALEFLGRADQQVKLRGFRIELGEVEAALRRHPAVRDAVARLRDDIPGDKRLVAYVATDLPDDRPTRDALREHLRRSLPGYMVPHAFVPLPALPLTPNGKVDRRSLPAPRAPDAETVVPPRDEVERVLAELWQQALQVPAVGVTQDFFDLGGHSLMAVGLLAKLERRLGRSLPVATLFSHPTVERLAALLRRGEPGADGPLVPLRPAGSRRPLFCVHPIGGGVLGYGALVRHLDPEQPVYGLEAPSLRGAREPCSAIEPMAAAYVAAVRRVQPRGPYRLLGWSMGGVVAFEMAGQLARAGEEVELLALLDSWTPALSPALWGPPPSEQELLALLALDMARTAGHPGPPLSGEDLAPLAPGAGRELLLSRGRAAGLLPPDVGLEVLDALLRTFQAHDLALRRYVPKRGDLGSLVLFRPEQAAAGAPLEGGWDTVVRSALDLRRVPGDHYSLLAEPHVRALARHLGELLERPPLRGVG